MTRAWEQMSPARRSVLAAAAVVSLVWGLLVFPRLVSTQNAVIRLGLTAFFSAVILLRRKTGPAERPAPAWSVAVAACAGVPAALAGAVFRVHQAEWLGLLLVLYACLRWALPERFSRDAARALFLLYWAHPLPAQVFGLLETSMQAATVKGSEWFLQLFNVRVWADGMVLRTGPATFEVPAWCSGMRAAATMFLLAAGAGMYRRFTRTQTAALVAAGLAQALALNVLRICAMVVLAPAFGKRAGVGFLHDTAGIIVLLGAALLYAEIALWNRLRERRAARGGETDLMLSRALRETPPFWRVLRRLYRPALALALAAAAAALLSYRSRAQHRADMLRDVVAGLQSAGRLEEAHRAAEEVLELMPGDEDWKMTLIRLMLARGMHERVIAELDSVPDRDEDRATEKKILRAYSFMSLGRTEESAAIVSELPGRAREEDPRVAMILAELGSRADNPDDVERYVRSASRWAPNARRIRGLYPYLRRYRRWDAIAATDRPPPYASAVHELIAAEAYMHLNNTGEVALRALDSATRWPDDPRVLEPLFYMAMKRAEGAWEERFAAQLVRSAGRMSEPDDLYALADKAFQLARPDLAWALCRRMAEIDPAHPYLPLMPARYGADWFTFSRRRLGLPASSVAERIDLRPHYVLGRTLAQWLPVCDQIPCGRELSSTNAAAARSGFLRKALDEFDERDRAGRLSLPMRYEQVGALEMAGDVEGAQNRLFSIAERFPGERPRVRLILSEMYERRGQWEKVYETLRGYQDTEDPQLAPLVRLAQACEILRLGIAALHVAREAVRAYPDSTQAAAALAGALLRFDSPEDALAVLSAPRPRRHRSLDALEAEALFRTQRFVELESFSRGALLPMPRLADDTAQDFFLPPAELSAVWHRALSFGDSEVAAQAEAMRPRAGKAESPFLRRMMTLWIECHDSRGGGDTLALDRWLGCGRDALEKATSVSQLAILLCWQRRFPEAREAAAAGVAACPPCPTLWRMLISLSGGDPAVVGAARQACPLDSEIWLAALVLGTQAGRPATAYDARMAANPAEAWAAGEIRRAAQSGAYSPGALTRAGEYLLRGGMTAAASAAARHAAPRARCLLPASVLGIRCALRERDREWALDCTRQAIRASLHPSAAIYEKFVAIKTADGTITPDGEMVEALKSLRREDPSNPLWAQMLGYVRFKRGGIDLIDALRHMSAALQQGATNRLPYLIAAEAARLRGSPRQAVDLLRSGLRRYPEDLDMLNNLAFTLAFLPDGAAEAVRYLPDLLARGGGNPHILDTASLVYLRSGLTNEAGRLIASILDRSDKSSRTWFVTKTRQAEMAFRAGKLAAASKILQDALGSGVSISDDDLLPASELMARIEARKLEEMARTNAFRRLAPTAAPPAAAASP